MAIPLAKHAMRWIDLLHFQKILPNLIEEDENIDEVSFFTELSGYYLEYIDRSSNPPLSYQQESVPYWVIFAMPKRPAVVNLASFLYSIKSENEKLYQETLSNLDIVLPWFIREHLFLFGITQSFRKLCNLPILNHEYTVPYDLSLELREFLLPLTTPLGILSYIGERISNWPISTGIALFRKIESLSYSLRIASTQVEAIQAIEKYKNFLDELSKFSTHIKAIEEIDEEIRIEQLKVKCRIDKQEKISDEDIDEDDDVITQEEKVLPDFTTWDILEAIYMRRNDYDYIRVTHYQKGKYCVVVTEKEFFDTYITSKSHVKWFKDISLASNYHKKIMHRRIKSGFEILSVNDEYRNINDFPDHTRYITPLTYGTDIGKYYLSNNKTEEAINLFLKLYQIHPNSSSVKEILLDLGVELQNSGENK